MNLRLVFPIGANIESWFYKQLYAFIDDNGFYPEFVELTLTERTRIKYHPDFFGLWKDAPEEGIVETMFGFRILIVEG